MSAAAKSIDHGSVYPGDDHRLFVGGRWDEIGDLQFDFLVSHGLRPHHVLVDVGCGALRGGVRFIPYLKRRRYLGLEAEPELLKTGIKQELGRWTQFIKKPEFVISRNFEFSQFSKKPHFGIAQSLFTHLNVHDIRLCLGNLSQIALPGMRFFVTFFEGDHSSNNPDFSHAQQYFQYSKREMRSFGEEFGYKGKYIGDCNHPSNQKMYLFRF